MPLASTFDSPVRPIRQLKGRREIVLPAASGQQGEIPPLVLHQARDRNLRAEIPIPSHVNIAKIAALEEHVVHSIAAVAGSKRLIRCEPVRALFPQRDSLAAYRAVSNDVSLIGVAIQVT